jgi:opacity protein-like surface antigen
MSRFTLSALVGAALIAVPLGALAADYPQPPTYVPPAAFHSDWYLKGYIGLAAQHFRGLEHPLLDDPGPLFHEWLHTGEFGGVPLFGVGVGFRHSDHLRFDFTGEYRAKSAFSALDRYSNEVDGFTVACDPGDGDDCGVNEYTGKKQELLFLANAYFDLNPIHGITPYVGAGIGASYNTIYNFTDINVVQSGGGWAPTGSKWSLAWALHAGASVPVNERLTLESGYSFLKLGDAQTGPFQNLDPTVGCIANDPPDCSPMLFKGIYSHDFKVGARWALGHTQPSYPVMAKY